MAKVLVHTVLSYLTFAVLFADFPLAGLPLPALSRAHLFRCAAAILLRAAALIVRFDPVGFGGFDFAWIAAHLFR